jgi:preprotein translocase subunit SecD
MRKNLGFKTAIIIVTLLVFVWGIFFGTNPEASWKAWKEKGPLAAMQENIHLGLDLRGGTHLILQVMVDEAVGAESDRTAERLKEEFAAKKITFSDVARGQDTASVVVKGVPPDQVGQVRSIVSEQFLDHDISSTSEGDLAVTMKPLALTQLKSNTVRRSIETIRGRVDALGVSEPIIQEHGLGEHQILVQLPGVDDPVRVRSIIQETGMLEYRHVLKPTPFATEAEAIASYGGVLPPNAEILPDGTRGGNNGFWVVSKSAVISGDDIRAATPGTSETGQSEVSFDLKAAAGKRFAAYTGSNIGNMLSVVLNRKVRQVATIQSEIRDRGRITGAFSPQEAKDLGKLLESGALPASIRYLEDRTVGASLGAESIKKGVTAGMVGLVLVVVFMLLYYHGAGINANLGLFLNVIILLGFLGYTGATLTLPGIAGVILTIGMGVDSNVLIFERIREELRSGKAPSAAVEHGFARAWLTIIDTHITTIVSALILFLFGTGPVRGFAVTLAFGLFANLFTAVFVSRVIFDAILSKKQRNEALSI